MWLPNSVLFCPAGPALDFALGRNNLRFSDTFKMRNERKDMKISRVGITRGELRAESNGSDFNVWIGGTSRTACPKEEAIEFFETKTTADQKVDKDAVVDWLKKQP
jgi:hypothetical protein